MTAERAEKEANKSFARKRRVFRNGRARITEIPVLADGTLLMYRNSSDRLTQVKLRGFDSKIIGSLKIGPNTEQPWSKGYAFYDGKDKIATGKGPNLEWYADFYLNKIDDLGDDIPEGGEDPSYLTIGIAIWAERKVAQHNFLSLLSQKINSLMLR